MKIKDEGDRRYSNLTSYSLKKFDEESNARSRYDRNIPLKKTMTHKQLFKDSVPIKEENPHSRSPREKQKREHHRNEKSLDAYPGVRSTEKLHKSGSREQVAKKHLHYEDTRERVHSKEDRIKSATGYPNKSHKLKKISHGMEN